MKYCEDCEGRCERKGKTVSFKRVCHRNEHPFKIPARYDYNLHRKISGRNAYDDSNYRKIIKADEGETRDLFLESPCRFRFTKLTLMAVFTFKIENSKVRVD